MLAGSLPFMIYYLLYTRRRSTFLRDSQVRLLGLLVLLGTASIYLDLTYLSGEEPLTASGTPSSCPSRPSRPPASRTSPSS